MVMLVVMATVTMCWRTGDCGSDSLVEVEMRMGVKVVEGVWVEVVLDNEWCCQ